MAQVILNCDGSPGLPFRIVCSQFFLQLPSQDRFSRGRALRMVRMPRNVPFIRVTRAAILFCAAAAASFAMAPGAAAQAPQIAFTWDDLPAHGPLPPGETRVDIGRKIVQAMKDAHLPPVYGFVNGAGLEREPASAPMLKQWRDGGLQLGNHTWSHMNLNTASLADWEADLLKNETVLQKYAAGGDWHWLRYPFLAEGNTPEKRSETRKFLAAHGYRIATVTMSFADYMWNEPYARCVAKNDTAAIAKLESSYLEAASADADFRRAMARDLFGRDIPYVLLMHVGAFDARMLPRLLKVYSDKGFTFVTLEDAEKDSFYKGSLDPSLPDQPDSLEGAMQAKGMSLPPRPTMSVNLNSMCR
jgi:peptidoglycan-N-acetylglucosamine deacetylase